MDLAEGMASAFRALGEAAEVRVMAHPDPAPLTLGRPNLTDKWRLPTLSAAFQARSLTE